MLLPVKEVKKYELNLEKVCFSLHIFERCVPINDPCKTKICSKTARVRERDRQTEEREDR